MTKKLTSSMKKANKGKRPVSTTLNKTKKNNGFTELLGIVQPEGLINTTVSESVVTEDSNSSEPTLVRAIKNPTITITVQNINSIASMLQLNADQYFIEPVREELSVSEYTTKFFKQTYVLGSLYYQLTKPELIHPYTNIYVQEIETGKVFRSSNIKDTLGIANQECKITIEPNNTYRLFVQSHSTNRKLVRGSFVLLRK